MGIVDAILQREESISIGSGISRCQTPMITGSIPVVVPPERYVSLLRAEEEIISNQRGHFSRPRLHDKRLCTSSCTDASIARGSRRLENTCVIEARDIEANKTVEQACRQIGI